MCSTTVSALCTIYKLDTTLSDTLGLAGSSQAARPGGASAGGSLGAALAGAAPAPASSAGALSPAGRCRAQCRTDRDCVNDWRCLSAGVANQSVCYAPDDYANACV